MPLLSSSPPYLIIMAPRKPHPGPGLYLKLIIAITIILTLGLYTFLFTISPWLVLLVVLFNVVASFSFMYADHVQKLTAIRAIAARMEENIELGRSDGAMEEDMASAWGEGGDICDICDKRV